jgi:hypothetical protein
MRQKLQPQRQDEGSLIPGSSEMSLTSHIIFLGLLLELAGIGEFVISEECPFGWNTGLCYIEISCSHCICQ